MHGLCPPWRWQLPVTCCIKSTASPALPVRVNVGLAAKQYYIHSAGVSMTFIADADGLLTLEGQAGPDERRPLVVHLGAPVHMCYTLIV